LELATADRWGTQPTRRGRDRSVTRSMGDPRATRRGPFPLSAMPDYEEIKPGRLNSAAERARLPFALCR